MPVTSVDERFDDNPSGQFARTVMTAVAELEKNLIRQRTMDGRAKKVREGKYMASITPFGYVSEEGSLLEHPENAEVVRQMFRWARDGLGLKAIGFRLEEKGVPPPSLAHPKRRSKWGWHTGTIYHVLTAPRYVGQNTYNGKPMACPALVDQETFDLVQEGLKRRKRNSFRNTKHFYLLRTWSIVDAAGAATIRGRDTSNAARLSHTPVDSARYTGPRRVTRAYAGTGLLRILKPLSSAGLRRCLQLLDMP